MDRHQRQILSSRKLVCAYLRLLKKHGRPRLPWAFVFFRDGLRSILYEADQTPDFGVLGDMVHLAYYLCIQCDIWLPEELRGEWERFGTIVELARHSELANVDWIKVETDRNSNVRQ